MIGFTPGPWFAHKHGRRSLAWRVTLTPGNAYGDIANILAGLAARTGDEAAANAHLIAAAPEMYAALETIASGVTTVFDEDEQCEVEVALSDEEIANIAHAAILKAEGRTP